MKLKQFDYELPAALIAQEPVEPRDHSRLFCFDRSTQQVSHNRFYNIANYLQKGDVLVLNNTKVFPARLMGKKRTGGKVEVFLLRDFGRGMWQVLLSGARRKVGTHIQFAPRFNCDVVSRGTGTIWMVQFNVIAEELWKQIYEHGHVPLPPYIKKPTTLDEYQTTYAQHVGSVAAPTAGFHFTPAVLKKLANLGVSIEYVTLHVGLGTFAPVTSENITEHNIHSEWGSIDFETAERLSAVKQAGGRIIAVGTTSVRTLEYFSDTQGKIYAGRDWIDLFIYPGYDFKCIDGMVTNFHLPKSSLIMLVAALLADSGNPRSGIEKVQQLYQQAIKEQYRFFSYGDGMLII